MKMVPKYHDKHSYISSSVWLIYNSWSKFGPIASHQLAPQAQFRVNAEFFASSNHKSYTVLWDSQRSSGPKKRSTLHIVHSLCPGLAASLPVGHEEHEAMALSDVADAFGIGVVFLLHNNHQDKKHFLQQKRGAAPFGHGVHKGEHVDISPIQWNSCRLRRRLLSVALRSTYELVNLPTFI